MSSDLEGHAHQHQALFYESDDEYLDGVTRFVAAARAAGEPVAAAVPRSRGQMLSERLEGSGAPVEILDMFELGRNPSRIIPAVERMLAKHDGMRLHYVGEPIWPGRSDEEIREATKHEALTNLAWPGAPIRVLCPYDVVGLSPRVLADAERTHPWLIRHGEMLVSKAYCGPEMPGCCDEPLPSAPAGARSLRFGLDDLPALRTLTGDAAVAVGLEETRREDLVLAVSELSTNAIRHGDGTGTFKVWDRPREIVCQVEDRGHIADPLAGRRLPELHAGGGLGLWMVNQLCDLVEVRTGERGTTVRLHVTVD
jgi:anti-sigma regulatory factor (Ser/Thr protein kinase)